MCWYLNNIKQLNSKTFNIILYFSHISGEKDGTGPCNGDSGGGLFINMSGKWMLRGIVSSSLIAPHTTNTCNLHEYVVYTDAAKYTSWIKQIMDEQ